MNKNTALFIFIGILMILMAACSPAQAAEQSQGLPADVEEVFISNDRSPEGLAKINALTTELVNEHLRGADALPDQCIVTDDPVKSGDVVGFFRFNETLEAHSIPGNKGSRHEFDVNPGEILPVIPHPVHGWNMAFEIRTVKFGEVGWLPPKGVWCMPDNQ